MRGSSNASPHISLHRYVEDIKLLLVTSISHRRAADMALPTVRIRLVEERDQKLVRFLVGKSNMECLAVANSRGERTRMQSRPLL